MLFVRLFNYIKVRKKPESQLPQQPTNLRRVKRTPNRATDSAPNSPGGTGSCALLSLRTIPKPVPKRHRPALPEALRFGACAEGVVCACSVAVPAGGLAPARRSLLVRPDWGHGGQPVDGRRE